MFHVQHYYTACATDAVELPDGKTFADIKEWHIKWGRFFYTFDGITWGEFDMNSEVEVSDWKRPSDVFVFADNGNGLPDYDNQLAARE